MCREGSHPSRPRYRRSQSLQHESLERSLYRYSPFLGGAHRFSAFRLSSLHRDTRNLISSLHAAPATATLIGGGSLISLSFTLQLAVCTRQRLIAVAKGFLMTRRERCFGGSAECALDVRSRARRDFHVRSGTYSSCKTNTFFSQHNASDRRRALQNRLISEIRFGSDQDERHLWVKVAHLSEPSLRAVLERATVHKGKA
jgi:hypothetical protein